MEIKDEEQIVATDSHGVEYVAETSAVYSMDDPGGTHYEAEIVTMAHPDDPTVVDSHMVITQTDPDGTESVTEYITKEDGTYRVDEGGIFDGEDHLTKVSDVGSTHHVDIPHSHVDYGNHNAASDHTTASDYLYTDTSFDVHPIETSVTAEDHAHNAEYNANYADYYQDQANIAHDTAVDYYNHGDADAGNVYAESAENHQHAAEDWATADD